MKALWTLAVILSLAFHIVSSADCGDKQMCEPNSRIKVECNYCGCNGTGNNYEFCTRIACRPSKCVQCLYSLSSSVWSILVEENFQTDALTYPTRNTTSRLNPYRMAFCDCSHTLYWTPVGCMIMESILQFDYVTLYLPKTRLDSRVQSISILSAQLTAKCR